MKKRRLEDYPFYLQNFLSKKNWIQLSRRQKKYMSEICQNVQKIDYQIFKWGCVLVLINVTVGFYIVPRNKSKIGLEWQSNIRSNSATESSNLYKQRITFKNLSNIIFGFSLCFWLIQCAYLNKQTEGIIRSNHSPRQVASDEWYILTWSLVLNIKTSAEKFE